MLTRPSKQVRPPSALRSALWRVRWRTRVAVRSRPRLLAALLVGVAVASGLAALRPPAQPSVPVTVAAHDLSPGNRVSASDLRTLSLPRSAALRSALSAAALVGRTVAAPVLAGEPVPEVRLLGPGLSIAAARTHQVAVPVRLPVDLAALLSVGTVVDLVTPSNSPAVGGGLGADSGVDGGTGIGSESAERGGAFVLAHGARVLAAPEPGTPSDGLLSGTAGSDQLLVLAVADDEASGVAAASAQGPLWPVLRTTSDPPQ